MYNVPEPISFNKLSLIYSNVIVSCERRETGNLYSMNIIYRAHNALFSILRTSSLKTPVNIYVKEERAWGVEKQGSRKKKHLRYNTVPSVVPSAVLNLTLPVDSDSKPVEHCISVSNEH